MLNDRSKMHQRALIPSLRDYLEDLWSRGFPAKAAITNDHNSLFESNTDQRYDQYLSGAHRKPPAKAHPPFLSCFLAFWKPLHVTSFEHADEARATRRRQIDSYIHSVWRKLNAGHAQIRKVASPNLTNCRLHLLGNYVNHRDELVRYENDPTAAETWASDAQAVTLTFTWYELAVTLRFELHSEYLSLTINIEVSHYKSPEELELLLAMSHHPGADVYRCLKSLNEKIEQGGFCDPGSFDEIHKTLYRRVWNNLHEDILKDPLEQELGTVKTDNRGLILGSPEASSNGDRRTRWRGFQKPFWRRPGRDMSTSCRGGDHAWNFNTPTKREWPMAGGSDMRTWQQTIDAFWPFFTVKDGGVDFRKYEFTACRMLDGDALYVSSLGVQPPALPKAGRFPLFYFLYCDMLKGWQIGRLIDSMNQQGMMRVAAVVQLPEMRKAADRLQGIEARIRNAIAAYNKPLRPGDADSEEELNRFRLELLVSAVHDVEQNMSALNADFDGNIEYRIERCRYYIERFYKGMKALRLARIEGYQPYDAFVERRLGRAFEFITMVGTQYERVKRDQAELFKYYLAQRGHAVEVSQRNRTRDLKRLLTTAEIVALGIIAPATIAGDLEHMVHGPYADLIWPLSFLGGLVAAAILLLIHFCYRSERRVDKLAHGRKGKRRQPEGGEM